MIPAWRAARSATTVCARRAADRLLAEHVLAGRGRGLDHLDVEHVGGGDEDDVDVVGVDDLVPIGHGSLIPERSHRIVAPRRNRVADDDQFWFVVAVEEVARRTPASPAVGLPHPSETDHTDSYRAHLVRPSFVVTGHRGSVAIPAHVSRTQ